MSSRWFSSSALALFISACAKSPPPPAAVSAAPPAAEDATKPSTLAGTPAAAPAPSRASGKRIGIGFAGNMIGEIEPCGCKANPTGGLARRMTILDAWRDGSPKPADVGEQEPNQKAPAVPASQLGEVKFDGFLVLDAGDTFADSAQLEGERLERATRTASLIVERFNAEGVKAQLVGDKDLALGREALAVLAREAKYPFITTNLVDARSRAPLFSRQTLVEVARLKVGVIGLVTQAVSASPRLAEAGLAVVPPAEAAADAIAELERQGAEVIVVLSQLSPAEEAEVAKQNPRIQLFLGGDQLGYAHGPQPVGGAMSLSGGHKGRSVTIAALAFDDERGASAPFIDPNLARQTTQKLADARRRVETYERLLADAEQKGAGAPEEDQPRPGKRSPIEAYRMQLAAARADVTLAEQQLAEAPEAPEGKANTVSVALVNLGREVPDDEAVKARVDAFRKDVPAPPGQ